MKAILRSTFVLVAALALQACSGNSACKEGTLLLTVDLSQAPAPTQRLTVNVLVMGGAPTSSEVSLTSADLVQTLAIEFPGGYPEGNLITVDVVAHSVGGALAVSSGSVVAPAGCATLTVMVGGPSGDAAVADGGGIGLPEDAAAALPDLCTPGATTCHERIALTCAADGSWAETEECAGVCSEGGCVGECEPGAARCGESGIQTCTEAASWSAETACDHGCAEGKCLAACVAGAKQCNGNQVETCDAAGLWGAVMACDNICQDGVCAGICSPGKTRCTGKVLEACSEQAMWVATETCEFVCTPDDCAGECDPGVLRCNAGAVETCSDAGAWQQQSACEFACSEGMCTPKMPGLPGVPPAVLNISPADGTKVRENETITIIFSEEMDPESVQAAFKPATPGAKAPTFKWSPDKTVLTVNPGFTYPSGTNPNLARGAYSFSLTIEAKDANGEQLTAPVARSYPLAYRRITTRVPWVQRIDNQLVSGNTSDKGSGVGTWLQVGFSPTNGRIDAFTTFSIEALPANIITFEQAFVASEVEVVSGAATGLGNLRIADLRFSIPFSAAAFGATSVNVGEARSATSLWKAAAPFQFTVLGAVRTHYAQRATRNNRSQFRFLFDGRPPANTNAHMRLLRTKMALTMIYLLD